MAAITCSKHPDYKVLQKPAEGCDVCNLMWLRKHARKVCLNPACKRVFVWRDGSDTKYCSVRCAYDVRVRPGKPPAAAFLEDKEKRQHEAEVRSLKGRYEEALKTVKRQERELGWLNKIREGVDATFKVVPRWGSGTSEATPILVASDWHSEEIVKPASVNGLNQFNPQVCDGRATRFFQSGLRLIRLLNQDVKVDSVVLALLGDFITNDIHEAESAENNALLPIDALIAVEKRLIGGIEFLLNNSKYQFVVPCKVGNHSRTTKKVRSASEVGHSLETLMYVHLADWFRNEPRVKFVIDDGYFTYVDVYDKVIRFHHGHDIQYQGGIGGLFIPAYKAISQWNKARRADLDVFGHFHQTKDGGNFLCNGSLIGYSAFSIRIKGDYEPPRQTLTLIDKKRGRTCTWPVLV